VSNLVIGLDNDRKRCAVIPMTGLRNLLRNVVEGSRNFRRYNIVSMSFVADGVKWVNGIASGPGDVTRFIPKGGAKVVATDANVAPTVLQVLFSERDVTFQWVSNAGAMRTAPLTLHDLQVAVT
jgi:hypothetical protein